MRRSRVWYVAYGSNLARDRFRCYLSGGRPAGSMRDYEGCRDPGDPTDDIGLEVPGGLLFAGSSPSWGGGMAFYDPDADGVVAGRAYLVTTDQLADVVAQEMRRPPGGRFALGLAELLPRIESVVTSGRGTYETIVRLGERDGASMFTVTHHDVPHLRPARPTGPYLQWICRGLHESHGWDATRVVRYLEASPGVRGAWTREDLAALVTTEPTEPEPT
jgi:hypothetical protein